MATKKTMGRPPKNPGELMRRCTLYLPASVWLRAGHYALDHREKVSGISDLVSQLLVRFLDRADKQTSKKRGKR